MPCDYVIHKAQRLVITSAVGVVTFEEMKAHQERLRKDPEFDLEFNQLIDASAATEVDLNRSGAQELTQRNIFSPKSKRALVAIKPAIFGIGRLLLTYLEMSDSPSQTHAFYELAPALQWLGLDALPDPPEKTEP
ncbi:MAG TPA: hypothetical protein VMI10_16085 [Terriglobales bacterium]|nr:hypothetical protein [Terriglobales bacterium]HVN19690.1 hypothetical protein [Dongiaceae bacterium]